jgi:hypothetical protein
MTVDDAPIQPFCFSILIESGEYWQLKHPPCFREASPPKRVSLTKNSCDAPRRQLADCTHFFRRLFLVNGAPVNIHQNRIVFLRGIFR